MEYVKLKKLLENKIIFTISPTYKLKNDEIFESGKTAVISQNKEKVIGYSSLVDNKLINPPYLLFGDHTEIFKWCKTNFIQGADGLKIIDSKDKKFLFFLYYALKACYYPSGFYERHYSKLVKTKIPVMATEERNKLLKILSAYDKLIENNDKRIAILEQEAEELYKEWFVRFRFPGHETRELKNVQIRGWTLSGSKSLNIPLNWEFCSFSKIGSFIRGKNITSDKMILGDIPVISAGLEPSGFHKKANVKGPSITISASGANAGYMSLHFSDIWAADCSYYQSTDWLWFAYCALKFLQPVITNMQIGAAQPHVYPKHIDKLFIVVPDNDILRKYNLLVDPIFKEIKNLQEQNTFLSNQRDYLLPRLMSGKLEVK